MGNMAFHLMKQVRETYNVVIIRKLRIPRQIPLVELIDIKRILYQTYAAVYTNIIIL